MIVTLYVAVTQYRASHAPLLSVIKVNHRLSRSDDFGTHFKVTVKNMGNGLCLDTFLLIKEIPKEKSFRTKNKSKFHLSKPTREIESGDKCEFIIHQESIDIRNMDVKYMVVYMDYFGRKYLASDVFNGVLKDSDGRDNKHLERFSKKAKFLLFWSPTKWKYIYWKRKAIKQRNTALGKAEKRQKNNSLFVNSFF